jgi:protocatechuate 3,4-dioxygenase beta subunit
MTRSTLARFAAFGFILLLGQITDKTTGQPLAGVHVEVAQGSAILHAVTGTDGRFHLNGVRPGPHTIRYSSDDVPPGSIKIEVRSKNAPVHITACSTTLDYSCVGPGGGG